MKRFLTLSAFLTSALLACSQNTNPNIKTQVFGTFEFNFDLDKRTIQVAPKLQAQGVLTPSQISFTPSNLGFLADATNGVNYISATFQVNNLTSNPLSDVTLVAYQKTGNRADTALKSLVDFNGTPLSPAQLDSFARAVQPVNMPTSLAPFTTNDNIADLQYLTESELNTLETAANSAAQLSIASNEYLFPYGFVARNSNTSRSIPVGMNQGTVTIALKLPNSNEPSGVTSSSYPRRFSMTFVAFEAPLAQRLTESYEERRGSSSAAARAAALTGFNVPSTNIAKNTAPNPGGGFQINGVRTAGSKTNLKHLLGERAWQLGTSGFDFAASVTTDSSGNVYAAGATGGGLDGNTSAGGTDFFVIKYNASGTKLWITQLGTSGSDYGYGVTTDSSGNVYVTGYTNGNLDGNTSAGVNDLFITKYNSSGVKQWTRQLGTSNNDYAYGVVTDSSGNVYTAGFTEGNLDGNTSAGNSDLFITKYNSSGVKQWTRQLGTSSNDYAQGIAIDSSSNIYVTGLTEGGLDGNTSAGGIDLFITKYDLNGNKQWTNQLGSNGNEYAQGIAIDSSSNIYVTGHTNGSLDGNTSAGVNDLFIVKYNSSGVKQWTRQLGNSGNNYARGIATDLSGNVYAAGYTTGGLDGNTSAGGNDLFFTKYNSSGVKQWTRQLGTSATDYAASIATDLNGNIFTAGYTLGSFGGAIHAGNDDFLLVRFDSLTNLYK